MIDEIDDVLRQLASIVETEYADIVRDYEIVHGKLRLYLTDGATLDVWYSRRMKGRYAYHWDRRHLNDTIYRWDNAGHEAWKHVTTYPHHFHEGDDKHVKESSLPHKPTEDIKYILNYAKEILRTD